MALFSVFRRLAVLPHARAGARPVHAPEAVQAARRRSRQRLIGAVVLVLLGMVVLPMLFDREPRPVSPQTRVELLAPAGAAPAPRRASTPVATRSPSLVINERAAETASELEPVPRAAAASTPRAEPVGGARRVNPESTQPAERAAGLGGDGELKARGPAVPASRPDDARARALLEGGANVAAAARRYVVQIGAFADPDQVRELRRRVDALGLRSYTQDIRNEQGRRIRVRLGPYADRAQAERALVRLQGAGLSGSLQPLASEPAPRPRAVRP